jgi:hypothetical protein
LFIKHQRRILTITVQKYRHIRAIGTTSYCRQDKIFESNKNPSILLALLCPAEIVLLILVHHVNTVAKCTVENECKTDIQLTYTLAENISLKMIGYSVHDVYCLLQATITSQFCAKPSMQRYFFTWNYMPSCVIYHRLQG